MFTFSRQAVIAMVLLAGNVAIAGELELEEIVVTARNREEPAQETPVSVTVFTVNQIERPGFDDLTDISRLAPNVIFDQGTGNTGGSSNPQVFIRGIGQVDFLFSSDPGVGVYVDEVYRPRVTGSILDLIEMERIEVLRGPQGMVFGKNTIGGAINIVSRSPEEEFGGILELDYGSRDRTDGLVTINIPFGESLRGRFSASTRGQDGYVNRILNDGATLGNVNSDAFHGQIQWTPGSDWIIKWFADYTRQREAAIANELIEVDSTSAPLLQLWNLLVAPQYGLDVRYDDRFLSDPFESRGTSPSFSYLDAWGTSLSVHKQISGALWAKSITAYRETQADFGLDSDHSPLRYLESANDNDHEQFSQEVRIGGLGFSGRLDWVAGGFFLQESGSDIFDAVLGGGLYTALQSLPAPLVPLHPDAACPPAGSSFGPCAGGSGNPLNVILDFELTIFDEIDIDSYAAFVHGTFSVTEKLNLSAGVRYTDDSKKFTTRLVRNLSGATTVPKTTIGNSWGALTPGASLEYAWMPGVMTYVSAARGFKSGGFNGRAQSIYEIDSFDPEHVWAYELGFKSSWFERRLLFNFAAFHNDYTNIQLTSVRSVDGLIALVTENAGQAKIDGFEMEVAALLVDSLLIRAGVGYLDAQFTELDSSVTINPDAEFVKAPKWTVSLRGEYEWPIRSRGLLTLGGDASFRSAYFNEVTNLDLLKQGSYTIFGAFLRFTAASSKWSLSLYGRNIADERYMTNGLSLLDTFGTVDATYGRPREWGLSWRFHF